MKRLINPHASKNVRDIVLLLVRLVIGALLLTHGFPKLVKLLSDEPVRFASVLGMSQQTSITMAMFAEFFCTILVMIGLFTRIAAAPVILTMLVIVFHIHWNDPFPKKELPLLYLASYILIFLLGPGKYSIDHLLHRRMKSRANKNDHSQNRAFQFNPSLCALWLNKRRR